jgi:hypothetical protein
MLLNEFLEENRKGQAQERKVQEQRATVTQLESQLAMQRKEWRLSLLTSKGRIQKLKKLAQIHSTRPTTPIAFNAR